MQKVGQNSPFFKWAPFWNLISEKKETISFFWSKLSKLHKKDPILHVTSKFSQTQGETRTSSEPIPHPLRSPGRRYASLHNQHLVLQFTTTSTLFLVNIFHKLSPML